MARPKRSKGEAIAIEASSGNVFEDLGLPDAGKRLAKAELARLTRKPMKKRNWSQGSRVRSGGRTGGGSASGNRE